MTKRRTRTPQAEAPEPAPKIPAIAVSVEEAARALGLGRTSLYAMMKAGTIQPLRIGAAESGKRSGRTLIPVAELHRLVAERGDAPSAA